ncbi:uncharacterized protein N7477_004721 [Penicillium maclennaniae]|uniref:uncharacterized protein n=1 Tax=Penicillium maclennaniae TaxID=1343394 RepID=UPI00254044E7|nr:uncharacterized protein N7477_004721 [Penicillium maclennaniae]KAJ5674787.1 hypothetical protein N7477_004721 [Penicillium maclennaniae]
MSGLISDARGSAEVAAENESQPRLVLAPVGSASYFADNEVSFSSFNTGSKEFPEPNDQATLEVNSVSDCDDGRVASDDEVRALLHVVDKIPIRLWVACLAGILERFVWYGATAPLQNYLQNVPGGAVPGALGLGQATASNIVNALTIGAYITPIPAAVIADSWLALNPLARPFYLQLPYQSQCMTVRLWGGVISASVLLAVGSGAFKTTVVPFIADQYDQNEFRIRYRNGKKVVADRDLTITYIYNVFYWAVNVICFLADCTPLLERYIGFWLAYLIPCCCMCLVLIPILIGRNYFVRAPPTSNMMPKVFAALRCGISGGFCMDAAKPDAQLQHDRQVPWSDSFIEDIKRSLLTCRVLLLFPIHWLCYNQTFNNLISQAGQMVTYGIPNDMIKIAGPISGIIVAPIIQKGLYPYLTRKNIPFRPITRMAVGFFILILSMVYVTVVQKLIYMSGPCYDRPLECPAANNSTVPNQISVFLQMPIYFSSALAEVFCMTTGTEYAYNNAPDSMKTLVQAIWLAMAGIGICLALAFTPLTKDPHLVTMYGILAGLLGVATILLWVIFRHVDQVKEGTE